MTDKTFDIERILQCSCSFTAMATQYPTQVFPRLCLIVGGMSRSSSKHRANWDSRKLSPKPREGILISRQSPTTLTKLIGYDIFGEDPREPYQIGATSLVKIRAVMGPMCLNSCSLVESSEAVLACAISFVMLP